MYGRVVSKMYQRKVRQIWIRRAVAFLVIVIGLYALASWGSQKLAWSSGAMSITGIQATDPADVVASMRGQRLGFLRFDNHILFSRHHAERVILENTPRIASVDIKKTWSTLTYSITERTASYIVCTPSTDVSRQYNNCWYVDADGIIFDTAPVFSPGVYLTFLITQPPQHLPQLFLQSDRLLSLSILQEALFKNKIVPEIITYGDHDVRVQINRIFDYPVASTSYILFDTQELFSVGGVDAILNRLDLSRTKGPLLERLQTEHEKFEYIDMRFADKFFFKFR
jgi:hypothetical protein